MIEILYILFLLSGIIKTFLTYYQISIGIDFTLFTMLIILTIIIKEFYKSNFIIKLPSKSSYIFIVFIILFIYILFSFFYTSSELFIYTKIIQFITIFIAFSYPLVIKSFSTKKFIQYFIITTVLISIVYLPLFLKAHSLMITSYTIYLGSPLYIIYGSYLVMGYLIGIALVLNLYTSSFEFKYKLLIGLLLLYILIITGARGPLIFFMLVLALTLFRVRKNISKPTFKHFLIVITLAGLGGIFILNSKFNVNDALERTANRLLALDNVKSDAAANDRLEQIRYVIEETNSNNIIFGHGFGSYGFERYGVDMRAYPHNVILELLFELGIIGVFLYSIILFLLIKIILEKKSLFLFFIFIFLFLNSLKSLSLVDSRVMFAFFAIILIYNNSQNTIVRKNK